MEPTHCPICQETNIYLIENEYYCPDCMHEWNPTKFANINEAEKEIELIVKDSNGNILKDGDTVVTIKDLPIKGKSQSIKVGTKAKNIKLTEGDHNIDCKLEGFGAMSLKSEFVKKI